MTEKDLEIQDLRREVEKLKELNHFYEQKIKDVLAALEGLDELQN